MKKISCIMATVLVLCCIMTVLQPAEANAYVSGKYQTGLAEGDVDCADGGVNFEFTSYKNGYVYACTYDTNIDWTKDNGPTVLSADGTTPATSIVDVSKQVSVHGSDCWIYKLNVLDKDILPSKEYNNYTPINVNYTIKGAKPLWYLKENNLGFSFVDYFAETNEPAITTKVGDVAVTIVSEIKTNEIPEVHLNKLKEVTDLFDDVTSNTPAIIAAVSTIDTTAKFTKIEASGKMEVSVPSDATIPEGGLKIQLTDDNVKSSVKAGDKVVVLHFKTDGTWEYIPAVAKDGVIEATFTSFSPVVWMKVVDEKAETPAATTTPRSPKTGYYGDL